jgi:hypothetical protein
MMKPAALPLLCLTAFPVLAGPVDERPATLQGQVTDPSGAMVPGASIHLSNSGFAVERQTDSLGHFVINGLAPGRYHLRAVQSGFGEFEDSKVQLQPGRVRTLNIALALQTMEQQVTVSANGADRLSTDPSANVGALILRGADLDALPDDPDDLAEALKALAGPSVGPGGPQFFIDGFSGGHLPPKESIREVRINQNPFSAEYDRLGFGRIEVFTKPGTDKFRGIVFGRFSDGAINSRNPYSVEKPPFQSREYGGNLSGPMNKHGSFFFDFERVETDQDSLVNATVVDSAFHIAPLNETISAPRRHTVFGPRLDYQLSTNNTLTVRYVFLKADAQNAGVGRFSLPSHRYNSAENEHTLQATETAVIGPRVVNETRFQYIHNRTGLAGDNSVPTISVLDSFTGGAEVGRSLDDRSNYELHNYTTILAGAHKIRFGGRFRAGSLTNSTNRNFAGTFVFSGEPAPQLDANNRPLLDAAGQPILAPITSIERYRRTLLFTAQGLSPAEVRALGGGASQFTMAAGQPQTAFSQVDAGVFVQDDWQVRPGLSVNLGLRYEAQSHLHDWKDAAPRVSFGWAPGARRGRAAKTVIRGGTGVFYDRFGENLVLATRRFDGVTQRQFVVHNPSFFPDAPSLHFLLDHNETQIVRRADGGLRAPYIIQSALGIERQLPFQVLVATTFTNTHAVHLFRSSDFTVPAAGRNIYQYESDGLMNQNQLITNFSRQLGGRMSLFGYYVYGRTYSNTDGANTFPANSFDLRSEYSQAATDVRHHFVLGGSILAPMGWLLNPFVVARSGAPFNITTGHDNNGDALFTDRPSLAEDPAQAGAALTRFGAFDPNPGPGAAIIPRNYARGPAFFGLNLRLSRTFGFGAVKSKKKSRVKGGEARGSVTAIDSSGGFSGLSRDLSTEHRYNMTFSILARNLLNTTNPGLPTGNLGSPWFGVANALASSADPDATTSGNNRRVQLQLRFRF